MSDKAWIKTEGDWFYASSGIQPTLDPGVYNIYVRSEKGPMFQKRELKSDVAIDLPGLPTRYIIDQIRTFWQKADIYAKYGFLQKRGILLYGPPGCGKTCIIKILCDEMTAMGGIILNISSFEIANACITQLRKFEPTRPILTLMEDIEGQFRGEAGPSQVQAALSMLDGQAQVNGVVHIATTNKPEEMADRFIKRPGRFDLVIGIHNPHRVTREAYLRSVTNGAIEEAVLQKLVDLTEGLGISYLRELASTHLCLDIPLEETLERLKANSKTKVFKADGGTTLKMGFTIGYDGKTEGSQE